MRLATPLLLALAGCQGDHAPRAIVLVVDGIRMEESLGEAGSELTGLGAGETWPRVRDELVPEGALVAPTWNAGATLTTAAHAALFSGARQPLATLSMSGEPGSYRPALPGLGEALRRDLGWGQGDVVLISNGDMIQPLAWSLHPDYGEATAGSWALVEGEGTQHEVGDARVFEQILERVDADDPGLILVNLKQVDRKGHYAELDDYLDAAAGLDDEIADLWKALQRRRGWRKGGALVVVSDHGRHREDAGGEYWRNHGDASAGDREVPLLLLGAGIEAGVTVDGPAAQEDLAPTLAALFGASLPWSTGIPLDAALTDPAAGAAPGPGVSAIAASGGFALHEIRTDDPAHRAAIWWGEDQLSDPDAWAAEAPAVLALDDGSALACWRELRADADWMPWRPRCATLGADGSIVDLPAITDRVGPFWRPHLSLSGGAPLVVYAHNPDDIASLGQAEDVAIRAARLVDGAWEDLLDPAPSLSYPADPVAVGGLIAFAAMPNQAGGQHERGIWLQPVEPAGLGTPTALELGVDRAERPALYADPDSGRLSLLALGFDDSGRDRYVLRADSDDAGATWGAAQIVASSPQIPAHLAPLWLGDRPAWVQVDGGNSLCVEDGGCEAIGGWVEDLAADGETVWAAVDRGVEGI